MACWSIFRYDSTRLYSVVATVLLLLFGPAVATRADEAAVRNYGEGFRKFRALGLPDVTGAEYVAFNGSAEGNDFSYSRVGRGMRLRGNAWMLDETSNGVAQIVIGGTRVREVRDWKRARKELARRASGDGDASGEGEDEDGPESGIAYGTWRPVELKPDVLATVTYVTNLVQDANARRSLRYEPDIYGSLFITAAHYYTAGFTNEANRIVDSLFKVSEAPRSVILRAMNRLADSQYESAYETFAQSTNGWVRFEADLNGLMRRYPAGWRKAGAVQRVAKSLKEHIEHPDPAPVEGEGLTDEDRALAAELARGGVGGSAAAYSHSAWVLREGALRQPVSPMGGKHAPTVVDRICARGVKSFPLLMALLGDETLIPGGGGGGGHSRYYSSSDWDQAMSDEELERTYQYMNRPATRGEVARALLLPVLPRKEDVDEDELTADDLRDDAKAWYEQHKDDDMVTLARAYLAEGSGNQKQNAMQILVRKGAPGDLAAVEKYLLESLRTDSSGYTGSYLISSYVSTRGAEAADFVGRVEAAVAEATNATAAAAAGGTADDALFVSRPASDPDEYKQLVERLRKIIEAKPAKQILAELLADPKAKASAGNVLARQLNKHKPAEAVDMLLAAAVKTDDVGLRVFFLQLLPQMSRMSMDPCRWMGMDDESDEPPKVEPLQVGTNAAAWKALLDDTRIGEPRENATIGEMAAATMEMTYVERGKNPWEMMERAFGGSRSDSSMMREALMARARARLAGTTAADLPPYPSAANVPSARRRAVVEALTAAPSDELWSRYAALTGDEKLAAMEELEQHKELKLRFLPRSLNITTAAVDACSAEAAAVLRGLVGRPLATNTLEAVVEVCRGRARAGSFIQVSIAHPGELGGWRLTARETAPGDKAYSNRLVMAAMRSYGDEKASPAALRGTIRSADDSAGRSWAVEPEAAAETNAVKDAKSQVRDALDDMGIALPPGMADLDQEQLQSILSELVSARAMGEGGGSGREEFDRLFGGVLKGDPPLDDNGRISISGSPTIPAMSDEDREAAAKGMRGYDPFEYYGGGYYGDFGGEMIVE